MRLNIFSTFHPSVLISIDTFYLKPPLLLGLPKGDFSPHPQSPLFLSYSLVFYSKETPALCPIYSFLHSFVHSSTHTSVLIHTLFYFKITSISLHAQIVPDLCGNTHMLLHPHLFLYIYLDVLKTQVSIDSSNSNPIPLG